MRAIRFRLAFAALLVAITIPQHVAAQVLYGSIVGTVEDPTGAIVPQAKITLKNTATDVVREVTADEQGRYNALNLPAGTYDIVVTAPGFRTLTRQGVEVTINNVTRVEAKLDVGQVSEQVTVAASTVALQTDRSDTRAEISRR